MTSYDAVKELVQNGNNTHTDIQNALDISYEHAAKLMKDMAEDGILVRERDGRSFVYHVGDGTPTETGGDDGAAGTESDFAAEREFNQMVVPSTLGSIGGEETLKPDRTGYDFDEDVPSRDTTPQYIEAGNEYSAMKAAVDYREEVGAPVRIRISGPQGAGKTLSAENIAADNGWPLFTINAGSAVPSDLKGSAVMVKDGDSTVTRWSDGTLLRALLSASERPTVLLIDEVNRAPPEVKSPLFSALDYRGQIEVPFTGERVRANPMNLIVFSTMNEGRNFHGLQPMDAAEKRRLSSSGKFNVDYLGVNHPEKEAKLISDSSPIALALAEEMVEVANHVRRLARNDGPVTQGIPTSEMVAWAKQAAARDMAGIDKPVRRAAEDVILGGVYEFDGGSDTDEVSEVRTIIESKFDKTPADPVAYAEYAGLTGDGESDDDDAPLGEVDSEAYECRDCGMSWPNYDALDAAGGAESFTCPDCDEGDVVRQSTL